MSVTDSPRAGGFAAARGLGAPFSPAVRDGGGSFIRFAGGAALARVTVLRPEVAGPRVAGADGRVSRRSRRVGAGSARPFSVCVRLSARRLVAAGGRVTLRLDAASRRLVSPRPLTVCRTLAGRCGTAGTFVVWRRVLR